MVKLLVEAIGYASAPCIGGFEVFRLRGASGQQVGNVAEGNESGSPYLFFIDGFVAGHKIMNPTGAFQEGAELVLEESCQ